MALSHDCLQQHYQEHVLTRRWVTFGVLGATGLHLGLLPLIGVSTDALVSRAEDDPIQIIVTAADAESPLSESPLLGRSFPEPLAAATPPTRDWSEASPPASLEESEPEAELEPAARPKAVLEPEEESGEAEPAPEEIMEPEALAEPEPEPEVAEAPEPEATSDAETPADLADTAAPPGAETVEGSGQPEQVADQPAFGTTSTDPLGDTTPVVALAPGSASTDGEGETPAGSTELGGLLEGYFPEGTEGDGLDSAGVGNVARGSEPGRLSDGNATEDSRGNGTGRGNGSRTVRCRSCDRPSYPISALAEGIEGEPQVSVEFDANGNVVNVTLAQSSGNDALDRAALASAERWQFDTGGQSGSISVEIPFVIEGSDRHREAQRRGDSETATIPNPGPSPTPLSPHASVQPTSADTTQQGESSGESIESPRPSFSGEWPSGEEAPATDEENAPATPAPDIEADTDSADDAANAEPVPAGNNASESNPNPPPEPVAPIPAVPESAVPPPATLADPATGE